VFLAGFGSVTAANSAMLTRIQFHEGCSLLLSLPSFIDMERLTEELMG
jgi:hypothetical protein